VPQPKLAPQYALRFGRPLSRLGTQSPCSVLGITMQARWTRCRPSFRVVGPVQLLRLLSSLGREGAAFESRSELPKTRLVSWFMEIGCGDMQPHNKRPSQALTLHRAGCGSNGRRAESRNTAKIQGMEDPPRGATELLLLPCSGRRRHAPNHTLQPVCSGVCLQHMCQQNVTQ